MWTGNLCIRTELYFAESLLFYFISLYSTPPAIKCSLLMLEDKVLCVYRSAQWSWEKRMCSPIVFLQVSFSSLVKTKIQFRPKKKEKKRIFCTFFGVFFSMCTINCFLANRTFNRELVCNCFKWSPYIPLGQKIEHWSYESGFCFCKKQRCTF